MSQRDHGIRDPRTPVLEQINSVFRFYGLPEWTDVKRIGKHRENEIEFTGVREVITNFEAFFVTVVFNVIWPDGRTDIYPYQININPGAVVVAVVNGEVLCVLQHRPTVGKKIPEIVRGCVPKELASDPVATAKKLIARVAGEAWVNALPPFQAIKVSEQYEDTGIRGDKVGIIYAEVTGAPPLPKNFGRYFPRLYSWERIQEMEDLEMLADEKSTAALAKVRRYLARR